jgi:hypothetical protein
MEVLQRRNLIAIFVRPRLAPASADRHEESIPVGSFVLKNLFHHQRVCDVGKLFSWDFALTTTPKEASKPFLLVQNWTEDLKK